MEEVLGVRQASDSEDPPPAAFPWHTACALTLAFSLGSLGWHWSYVLPLFWILLHMDERRRRRVFAVMKREVIVGVEAAREARKGDISSGETVAWLNQLLRDVWRCYEPPIARYVQGKVQPYFDQYVPRSLGIVALYIKSFSFGSTPPRSVGGSSQRAAPLVLDQVKIISKSNETMSKDRIHVVLQADLRWHTGSTPSIVLGIQVGTKLLNLSVDAEVRDIIAAGTMRIDLGAFRRCSDFTLSPSLLCHVLVAIKNQPRPLPQVPPLVCGAEKMQSHRCPWCNSLVAIINRTRHPRGHAAHLVEWIRSYPWLGSVSLAFVRAPSVDFKLSLGGSPDVMDLAPPLRNWLKILIEDTMRAYMVRRRSSICIHRHRSPLSYRRLCHCRRCLPL